jgi:3',5'-nucleoside bisphosphate phosphatase
VFETAGKGTVGRLHVARALVNRGFITVTWEAFHKYIGDKGPAYVLGFKLSSAQAIRLIREAGGVAVLAHPYCLGGEEMIDELVDMGIQGIEAYYPEHTAAMTKTYLAIAAKKDLLVTGGSDFHGSAKPDVRLGLVKVEYGLVERLKKAAAHA